MHQISTFLDMKEGHTVEVLDTDTVYVVRFAKHIPDINIFLEYRNRFESVIDILGGDIVGIPLKYNYDTEDW